MPISIEDLLTPISADQPAGADLRYAPIADQIREARRYEENIAQGEWKRDIKTADYLAVIDLAQKALRRHGKDLHVAAWLTEALLAREGIPGLRQGLELVYALLTNYWEGVYPQIEDGDLDLRASPLIFVGSQLDGTLKQTPVTKDGVSWIAYTDSRTVPSEQDAQSNRDKAALREEALESGKLSPEKFEKSFESTPVQFYEKLRADLQAATELVGTLSSLCDQKFGLDAPDFSPLRTSLEEFGKTVHVLFLRKGGSSQAPAPPQPDYQEPQMAEPMVEPSYYQAPAPVAVAAPPAAAPSDDDAALQQIIRAAHFLRARNPYNPVPYLALRAIRWGELRAPGYLEPALAEAPSTGVRIAIRNLFSNGSYEETLTAAEQAMASPCGRAWIDLQRFAVRSCRFTGNENVARAILSELKALLSEFPDLLNLTLNDDTPAVNAETRAWLLEEGLLPREPEAQPLPPPVPEPEPPPRWSMPPPVPSEPVSETGPDVYALALDELRSGRATEAIRLLAAEVYKQQTGRERFLRTSQLAQICLAAGRDGLAAPLLQQLAAEIDRHALEDWESRELVVEPLSLLYQCAPDADKPELYARICRIDPVRAMDIQK